MSIDNVELETGNDHACTGVVMSCSETGRTIASFWHVEDADDAAIKLNTHDQHVARIAELECLIKSYKHAADRLTQYKNMFSYNDSYAGEPSGFIKDAMGDLDAVSRKAANILRK